jgi:hypothetical protein
MRQHNHRTGRRRLGLIGGTLVAALAGASALMLAAPGIASASVDQTTSQYAEIGPYGYTGNQSSDVTAVYTIQNVAEPGTQMLEDNGNSMTEGTPIDVWQQINQGTYQDPMGTGPYGLVTQANYLWEFVPANPSNGPSIVEGYGELINRQSGLCLDVANNNTSDGAAMDQWPCNGGANQQWAALQVPFSSSYTLLPELDAEAGTLGALGVGDGSTCTTNGDSDSVYVRTTGYSGNSCDEWDIQQASYDFATHPITVPGADDGEVDNRSYECLSGDTLRLNRSNTPGGAWDNHDLSDGGVHADVNQVSDPPNDLPGGDLIYDNDSTSSNTGQIMLYCDPPSSTP